MLSFRSDEVVLPEATRLALRRAFLARAEAAFGPEGDRYPPPDGLPELRERIAAMTPHWDGGVLVTNSATEATWLALRAVASAGGRRLAVMVPCYFGVLRQAADLGLEVLPWETPDQLEALPGFDAALLTSNFTPPHGRSFTDADKLRIARLADARGAVVVEDNPYDPLWFDAPPTAVPAARAIRVGSLSKIASPRFRLGFLRASGDLAHRLRSLKITVNLSSPPDMQAVAAAALEPALLDRLRAEMRARADAVRSAVRAATGVECPEPQGGSYLCLPLDGNPVRFAERCAEAGVAVDVNAHQFTDRRPRPWARLHLGACALADVGEAVRRLAAALSGAPLPIGGRRVLVTGGTPVEPIDGVRHYACHSRHRPRWLGRAAAARLAALGASAVLVAPPSKAPAPPGVEVVDRLPDGRKIVSAADVAAACQHLLAGGRFDAALNLAATSSVRPLSPAAHKLKVKSEPGAAVALEVARNVDLLGTLRASGLRASGWSLGGDYERDPSLA
jgi:2-aminoadipate transaminase